MQESMTWHAEGEWLHAETRQCRRMCRERTMKIPNRYMSA